MKLSEAIHAGAPRVEEDPGVYLEIARPHNEKEPWCGCALGTAAVGVASERPKGGGDMPPQCFVSGTSIRLYLKAYCATDVDRMVQVPADMWRAAFPGSLEETGEARLFDLVDRLHARAKWGRRYIADRIAQEYGE